MNDEPGKYGKYEIDPATGERLEYITPNTVVESPKTRRQIGNWLWVISLLAGIAALFFQFFPEAALGTDVPLRAISFANAVVSLVTGAFGLVIVRPNTPTEPTRAQG